MRDACATIPAVPHLNVELKAYCVDPDETLRRLAELGARHQGVDTQTDVYYRVPKGRLKLRRGEWENNLIHYNRSDEPAPKESHVSLVPLGNDRTVDNLIDAALNRDVVVAKSRHIVWLGNVKFHVDNVAELGSFVEIEAIDYGEQDSDTLLAQCHEYMQLLGIRVEDLDSRSYSDMLRPAD